MLIFLCADVNVHVVCMHDYVYVCVCVNVFVCVLAFVCSYLHICQSFGEFSLRSRLEKQRQKNYQVQRR